MKRWVLITLSLVWASGSAAEEVTVAVASNFLTTAEKISADFEAATGHQVVISHGSTGQLYSQVEFGAPFDIFLSADQERPAALAASGKASRTATYAMGQLVIASRVPLSKETAGETFAGRTAALADPIVAPYGKAATAAMERLKLDTATFRPILVANVGQVGAIFSTGNADIAFVARSQLAQLNASYVLSLEGLVPDLPQDAAFLQRAKDNPAAEAFWTWLFSDDTAALIEAAGYGVPAR